MNKEPKVVARFLLEIDYEELPETSELRSLVDVASEYGAVVRADFRILQEVQVDLRH